MKIKKLFKFIPVVCLSALTCLSAVLSKDQAVKESYADSNYLISSRTISNIDYTYTNSNVTFHTFYSFEYNLYNDLSDNTFFWLVHLQFHNGRSYFTYNSNNYYMTPTPDDSSYTYTFTTSKCRLVNQNNNSANVILQILRTYSSGVGGWDNSFGTGVQYWEFYTRFRITMGSSFSPTYLDFDFNGGSSSTYGYMTYGVPQNYNLNTSAIANANALTLLQYTVDFTRSNYDAGYEDGYSNGYNTGFNDGYVSGNDSGYTNGYDTGYTAGAASRDNDVTIAYDNGYAAGLAEGTQANSTAVTIFSGILQVGMLPINVLLAIFNFEVLGINISSLVSALLTVCLTVIVIRTVTGSKE